ncbi:MAG: aspartate/glutamate racemase family protein [Pseudomonadota bacterium]
MNQLSHKRIKMIVPVPVPDAALASFAAQLPAGFVRPDIVVDFACAPRGGATLDSYYEGTLADAFCLAAGMTAEEEGYAAVCVNSMSDSGVAALRSCLSIPVIGTAQATYLLACQLGSKFSIISMWDRWRWLYEKVLGEQRLDHRLASIRSIGVRPDAAALLNGKEEEIFPQLETAARRAIEEDGANVLILGSTTMHQSYEFLARTMPVPVLNPGMVAYKACEMLLDLGLSHSKSSYYSPEKRSDHAFAGLLPSGASEEKL